MGRKSSDCICVTEKANSRKAAEDKIADEEAADEEAAGKKAANEKGSAEKVAGKFAAKWAIFAKYKKRRCMRHGA